MVAGQQPEAGQTVGMMTIEFLNGAIVRYSGVPMSAWVDLFKAPSKGKFLYHFVIRAPAPWAAPYALLSPATRRVTAAMKQANG